MKKLTSLFSLNFLKNINKRLHKVSFRIIFIKNINIIIFDKLPNNISKPGREAVLFAWLLFFCGAPPRIRYPL